MLLKGIESSKNPTPAHPHPPNTHTPSSMQLFVLAQDPRVCARLHCDKHVVKMCVETTQILYSALEHWGIRDRFERAYRVTHLKHPCVLWTAAAVAHFEWVLALGVELCGEYRRRYAKGDKQHACLERLLDIREKYEAFVPDSVPREIGCDEWLERLRQDSGGSGERTAESCGRRVAQKSAPQGCRFGVACVDADEIPATTGPTSLTRSYRLLYARRAVEWSDKGTPMMWKKQRIPRKGMRSIMKRDAEIMRRFILK